MYRETGENTRVSEHKTEENYLSACGDLFVFTPVNWFKSSKTQALTEVWLRGALLNGFHVCIHTHSCNVITFTWYVSADKWQYI